MSWNQRIVAVVMVACGAVLSCASARAQGNGESFEGCGVLRAGVNPGDRECFVFTPDDGRFPLGLLMENVDDFQPADHVLVAGNLDLKSGSVCLQGEGWVLENTIEVCPFVPSVSAWGVVILGVILVAVGTVVIRRREITGGTLRSISGMVLFALCAPAFGQAPPTAQRVKTMLESPHDPQRLLVRFKTTSDPAARAGAHANAGAAPMKAYPFVSGLQLVKVAGGDLTTALTKYLTDPNVLYAEPDYEYQPTACPPPDPNPPTNDPDFALQWGLHNVGQDIDPDPITENCGTVGADIRAVTAWSIWTGDPDFRIAMIDTGINYNHPDLAGNIWTNPEEIPGNGVDDDNNGWVDDIHGYDMKHHDDDPMDESGITHGTHVGGIVGAIGDNLFGVAGVNWKCKLVPLRICGGTCSTSYAVEAMEYVIANDIKVSNNSWGGSIFSQAHYDAIEASQDIGHVFVAAAGNSFGPALFYPASYDLDNIIAVAATDNNDNRVPSSNFGVPHVDIGAPGGLVYSTVLGSSFAFLTGTSMASPHAAGTVALVMSKNPGLSWEYVPDRIFETVRRIDALDPGGFGEVVTGGVVNAAAALGAVGTVEDCNFNGIDDATDIANQTSADCNANAYPDECEIDCDDNGVPDTCDVDPGDPDGNGQTSADCNANDIPDGCEIDCNANGVPDDCDIAGPTSTDCNANTIPDECEPDCNTNGTADECDISAATSQDCNANGVPDECENTIFYVDATAGGGGNGSSWATAFQDIQPAIDAASAGNEVWVRGSFGAQQVFAPITLKTGVRVYGGFPANATTKS